MSLIELFTPLSLVINWIPGKTEIMLKWDQITRLAYPSKVPICVLTVFTLTNTWRLIRSDGFRKRPFR